MFSCLNIVGYYNLGVGGVDVAYQLQLVYWPERFLWNLKFWWGGGLWEIGVVVTNSCIFFVKIHIWEAVNRKEHHKNKGDIPKLLNCQDFIPHISVDLIWTEYVHVTKGISKASLIVSATFAISSKGKNQRADSIVHVDTETCLRIRHLRKLNAIILGGNFPSRLDGNYHPPIPTIFGNPYQFFLTRIGRPLGRGGSGYALNS